MPNCRSITAETWAHARECLVFYFSRRHGRNDAEDLAQETLLSLWNREDYEFEKDEDFLKVCYGFARHITQQANREAGRHTGDPLEPCPPAPEHDSSGQRAMESRILLEEVCRIGESRLREREWKMIQQAVDSDRATLAEKFKAGDANNLRVHLHRARKKLAKLAGLE